MSCRAVFSLVLAVALLASSCTASRTLPRSDEPARAGMAAIRPEEIRAHMEFLADDLLEGRGNGTRGYDIAARYVASQFHAMGLVPAGIDGYYQPVAFRTALLRPEGSSVSLTGPAGARLLQYGTDYLISGSFLGSDVAVEAPVVFIGYGISAPDLGWDDYAGIDARGKIVATLAGGPAALPPDPRAHHASTAMKERTAAEHGAVGVIKLRGSDYDRRFPWDTVVRNAVLPHMRWVGKHGHAEGVRSELRADVTLSRGAAEALLAGSGVPAEEILDEARFTRPHSFDLPVRASIRTATLAGELTSPNVAGVVPGSDPVLRNEYVVYTAHLDHLGITTPVGGDAINNGAMDNAGGVAMMLAIARAFDSLPAAPKRSILFLAVCGEERGLRGSDYYAANPTVPIGQIVADVNVDMFLMLFPPANIVAIGGEHSTLGADAHAAAAALGLGVAPDPAPEETVFVRSDHYNFVKRGIPSIFVDTATRSTDPAVDGAALQKEWLLTVYHTPKDGLAQKIDYAAGVKYAQVDFLIGYRVANRQERPQWTPGDFFGKLFAGGH